MLKAVIIDDEKKSRQVLIRLLQEAEVKIEILSQASSVEEGFTTIEKEKPNLIFLDVEMLDGTGFNLLEKFKVISFEIIFITAYDHYAIKAFKYSAIDYILKPINIDELSESTSRAKKSILKNNNINAQIGTLLNNLKSNNSIKKIAIKSADRIDFVEVNDIIYCQSQGSYTDIILVNNKKIISSKPLKHFDYLFSEDFGFFRANRSHLINLSYMTSFKKEKEIVELQEGILIEISRRRKKEFTDILKTL